MPLAFLPIYILWSRDGNLDNRSGAVYQPNHFVPLVCNVCTPKDNTASATAPTAPVTAPTAPVSVPTAPVTAPTAHVSVSTAPVTAPSGGKKAYCKKVYCKPGRGAGGWVGGGGG